jgi:hypothetical protein
LEEDSTTFSRVASVEIERRSEAFADRREHGCREDPDALRELGSVEGP